MNKFERYKASVRERMSNLRCSNKNIATMPIERELERIRTLILVEIDVILEWSLP